MNEPILTVNNLGKRFKLYRRKQDRLQEWLSLGRKQAHQDFWAIRNINFELEKGDFFGILGHNGAGKSTLLKSICGLVDKKDGKITYQNRDINGLVTEKLVDLGVIYISENRELFPYMTVLENLKLGAYTKNAR